MMDEATYYKCGDCGYEFLANAANPACPKCQSHKLEKKDLKALLGLNE